MADFNEYDPGFVVMSWNGIPIRGFMEGSMIKAERNEESYKSAVGTQGDVCVVRNRNRSGKITFYLQQSSLTNTLLSAELKASEGGALSVGEFFLEDLNGNTTLRSERSWIMKPPAVEFSNELTGREWELECAELLMDIGGNE